MTIRPAKPDDYDAVATVWHEAWRSTGLTHLVDPSWTLLRNRIDEEFALDHEIHVAEELGAIIGMLMFRRRDCYLDQMFVSPAWQGNGFGRALLAFARREMPRQMWLRCVVENSKAWRWYEREGFVLEKVAAHETLNLRFRYYRWRA
jgi:ribosomal protein S18 acetylase RimI-like enzyme